MAQWKNMLVPTGASNVGNSGFYIRGNDVQLISSKIDTLHGNYPGIKVGERRESSGVPGTPYGRRIEIIDQMASNIVGGTESAMLYYTSSSLAAAITLYSYKLHNVAAGERYEGASKVPPVAGDVDSFEELTWEGIGGEAYTSNSLPTSSPVSKTSSPTLSPVVSTSPTAIISKPTNFPIDSSISQCNKCEWDRDCALSGNECCSGMYCEILSWGSRCRASPYPTTGNCIQVNKYGCNAASDCCNPGADCIEGLCRFPCQYGIFHGSNPTESPTIVSTSMPTESPTIVSTSTPTESPNWNNECMCQFSVGCESNRDCCSGLYCKQNGAWSQCVENSIYMDKASLPNPSCKSVATQCGISDTDFGCSSDTDCCNSSAKCGRDGLCEFPTTCVDTKADLLRVKRK